MRAVEVDLLPKDPEAGLSYVEAAALMGVSESTFRRLVRENKAATYPVRPGSSHRRVTRGEVDRLRRTMMGTKGTAAITVARKGSELSTVPGDAFLRSLGRRG
jgi:excisionase family DNA binding protein